MRTSIDLLLTSNIAAGTWATCKPYIDLVPVLCHLSLVDLFQTDSFTYAFHRAELVGMKQPSFRAGEAVLLTDMLNLPRRIFQRRVLLALALSICLQSLERFVNVEVVDSPKLVLIIGCVGLGLNILSAIVVHGEC